MTNINIKYEDKSLMYIIDYIRNTDTFEHKYMYKMIGDNIYFKTDLIRYNNIWKLMDEDNYNLTEELNTSCTIRLYFPQHSVETYNKKLKYVLDLYIYINEVKIVLGSFLIDRSQALASPRVIKYHGQDYYESIDLEIIDPYDILYSDKFEAFRKSFKNNDLNYDGTSLYASLHPIYNNNGNYLKSDEYNGGQNSINITNDITDYLTYNIREDEIGNIFCKLSYNSLYNDDLLTYLKETYYWETDNVKVKYILALDKLTPAIMESDNNSLIGEYEFKYNKINSDPVPQKPQETGIWCLINNNGVQEPVSLFSDWKLWQEGLSFISKAVFYTINEDGEEINKMILTSNKIPLSQELYSKLRIKNQLAQKIDFEDMNNINIVNTINNETVLYNTPENSKNNIILPVFYRVRDLGNIVIHPEVNENICINLDPYKSKVDSFIIQIEGIKFKELGTTGAGTIFNVIGNMLPGEVKSGTYYIMSQNGDLITTGKYIYEY